MLTLFFSNPYSEFHLREIARRTRMDPATALRAARMLEKEGLLQRRRERHASFFRASMNPAFKALKIAYTISLFEDKKIAEKIAETSKGLSSILLYGSAARGEDDSKSDYDILVIASECKADAMELGSILGRETSIQAYSISEWSGVARKNRAFYLEAISSSVALKGEKPVVD